MTSIIFVLILTSLIIENSNKSNFFSTVKQLNNESDCNKITNYSSYKNLVKINNKRFKEVVNYWKIPLSNQNLTVILQISLNKSFNNNDTKFKSNFKYSPYSKTYPVQINKKFKEIVDYWKISLLNQNLNANKSFNNNDKNFKSDLNYSSCPVKISKNFKEIVDYWKIKNYEIFPFLSSKYLLSENLITLTELNALKFDSIIYNHQMKTITNSYFNYNSSYSKVYPVQINEKFKEIIDYWEIKNGKHTIISNSSYLDGVKSGFKIEKTRLALSNESLLVRLRSISSNKTGYKMKNFKYLTQNYSKCNFTKTPTDFPRKINLNTTAYLNQKLNLFNNKIIKDYIGKYRISLYSSHYIVRNQKAKKIKFLNENQILTKFNKKLQTNESNLKLSDKYYDTFDSFGDENRILENIYSVLRYFFSYYFEFSLMNINYIGKMVQCCIQKLLHSINVYLYFLLIHPLCF